MELAPDFFSYFEALGKVMDADPSVYAVSSWNDNGQKPHAWDDRGCIAATFSRDSGGCSTTDCGQSSPPSGRTVSGTIGCACARREAAARRFDRVCRTFNFGEKGASKGLFFKTYLESIRVAENPA